MKPRRTIRIGLWSAEEQGTRGSRAYVAGIRKNPGFAVTCTVILAIDMRGLGTVPAGVVLVCRPLAHGPYRLRTARITVAVNR
jgi:hypothetical protein